MAVSANSTEPYQLNLPTLRGVRLHELCLGPRFATLDRLHQYAECRQYDALQHNWDGYRVGYAGESQVYPGYYVQLDKRRPSVRFNLGKLIVGRLTAMALGEESWPEVSVPGDPEAEDYAKALATESKLQARVQEARNKGGGTGTAVVSFSFLEGLPRVKAHEAKHMHPIRWADRDEHVLSSVLKCYRYSRTVWGPNNTPKQVDFYFARFWDEQLEVVWDPIPDALARDGTWVHAVKSYTVRHGYGECPVYWTQNLPDSEREDGVADIDGLEDTFDQINRLLSASSKGTIANLDPTLVIKDDPGSNTGTVQKGQGAAIFSKGGAEYLELKGDAVKTGNELVDKLTQGCLNVAGVVVGDPEKMGGKAQSSVALKMLYLPMCNQADLLRVQYGSLIVGVLRGMLRAARLIGSIEPGPVIVTEDGQRIQNKPVVILPPKIETKDTPAKPGEPSKSEQTVTERTPGESDRIELKWPPYFQPTMTDINQMVEATTKAKNQTISQRTAVKFTAAVFGVEDVDQELAEIDVERERAALLMGQLPEGPEFDQQPPGKAEDGGSEE